MDKILQELNGLLLAGRHSEVFFILRTMAIESLNLLGLTGYQLFGNSIESEWYLRKAMDIDPGNWLISCNIAHILNCSERYEEALVMAERSKSQCGDAADPYYNAGVILASLNRFEEAIVNYRIAHRLRSTPSIRYNLGCALLTLGNQEGLAFYESRMDIGEKNKKVRGRFSAPDWTGDPLGDRTLLIYNEQGVGDLFHFMRYIPLIKGKVIVEVQEAAAKLFSGEVIPRDDNVIHAEFNSNPYPGIDCVASVCSLPYLMKCSLPPSPYIFVPGADTELNNNFRIGICWAGSKNHGNDNIRSCPLRSFSCLEQPGITFYSFQKSDLNLNGDVKLEKAGNMDNFYETASWLRRMDLVISVDTAVAHLAGAMGMPVWLLCGYQSDWRWGKGESSELYSSMRIFRQKVLHDWSGVFKEVAAALQTELGLD